MTVEQMRIYISHHPKYKDSPRWRVRCMNMSDLQVCAVYHKFRKLDYRKIEREMKKQNKDNSEYHQINMFEYMEGLQNGT